MRAPLIFCRSTRHRQKPGGSSVPKRLKRRVRRLAGCMPFDRRGHFAFRRHGSPGASGARCRRIAPHRGDQSPCHSESRAKSWRCLRRHHGADRGSGPSASQSASSRKTSRAARCRNDPSRTRPSTNAGACADTGRLSWPALGSCCVAGAGWHACNSGRPEPVR